MLSELRLLSWKGYKAVLAEHERELRELGLIVKVIEDLDADRILRKFSGATDSYDVVIVDWEYRHKYERLVLPISDKHVRLSGYLEPFRDRYWYEVGNRLSYVPLRFGTNGFVYRVATSQPREDRFTKSLKHMLAESHGRIAIWDWWLPNMLLLARAEGFDPPHELTYDQLRDLQNGLLAQYFGAARSHSAAGPPLVFHSLLDIITYEVITPPSERNVDWILGPSEMVVAPVSRAQRLRSISDSIDWDIPLEGGLVWLETAALSRDLADNREKLDAAYRLLDFLQSPAIQVSLLCGSGYRTSLKLPEEYWSYVLNNTEGLDGMPPDYKAVFHNQFFEESALRFGKWINDCLNKGHLVMRALPTNISAWRHAWKAAVGTI